MRIDPNDIETIALTSVEALENEGCYSFKLLSLNISTHTQHFFAKENFVSEDKNSF